MPSRVSARRWARALHKVISGLLSFRGRRRPDLTILGSDDQSARVLRSDRARISFMRCASRRWESRRGPRRFLALNSDLRTNHTCHPSAAPVRPRPPAPPLIKSSSRASKRRNRPPSRRSKRCRLRRLPLVTPTVTATASNLTLHPATRRPSVLRKSRLHPAGIFFAERICSEQSQRKFRGSR